MCGIAMVTPADPHGAALALERMRHRGPDDCRVVNTDAASLGVARLAITDVAGGPQPFVSPSAEVVVGFNGAIYNAEALARRFSMRLASGNDGEVIRHLYDRFGLSFAGHLEGMYAICIWDARRSRFVVAVDPIGIKPLHVAATARGWFAASTLQALPGDLQRTAFRVPPGVVWSSSGESRRIEPQTVREGSLAELLEASVAEQVPREVPWGCLLSGGLDSSTVTALASRGRSGVATFTAGLPGSSDMAAAAVVARFLGTDHRQVLIQPEELPELLDAVIGATATPDPIVVLGGVGTFAAARAAARDGLKVLLSGEGADELFGGYDDYLAEPRDLLDASMRKDQRDLGATECLRLDRCTMAHGVEARVPFLSSSVIHKARALPLEERIAVTDGVAVHKVALRRFARSLLPESIATRPKAGFPGGSGTTDAVRQLAERLVSAGDVEDIQASPSGKGYLELQRALGVDERVAALTWRKWSEQFPNLAASWTEMVERGLAKRTFGQGDYAPAQWDMRRPVR